MLTREEVDSILKEQRDEANQVHRKLKELVVQGKGVGTTKRKALLVVSSISKTLDSCGLFVELLCMTFRTRWYFQQFM